MVGDLQAKQPVGWNLAFPLLPQVFCKAKQLSIFNFANQCSHRSFVCCLHLSAESFDHCWLLPVIRNETKIGGDLLDQGQNLRLAKEEMEFQTLRLLVATANENHHQDRHDDEQAQNQWNL